MASVNSSRFDIAAELSSTIKIANHSKATAIDSRERVELLSASQGCQSSILVEIEREREEERERGRKRARTRCLAQVILLKIHAFGNCCRNRACQIRAYAVNPLRDLRRQKDERRVREERMDKDGSRRWWLEMKDARTMATIGKGQQGH